jgi:hypothetical protein
MSQTSMGLATMEEGGFSSDNVLVIVTIWDGIVIVARVLVVGGIVV